MDETLVWQFRGEVLVVRSPIKYYLYENSSVYNVFMYKQLKTNPSMKALLAKYRQMKTEKKKKSWDEHAKKGKHILLKAWYKHELSMWFIVEQLIWDGVQP